MKYILFDLDGTITDPKEGITKAVAYSLRHYGINVEDRKKLTPFIGPPLNESFMKYYGFSYEKSMEAVDIYREYYRPLGIFELSLYEGINTLLSDLKNYGYVLAIASSKPEEFVKKITEHYLLSNYFAEQVGSEMDGRRVHKTDVIFEAKRRLGISEMDTVYMVGDRNSDLVAARKNDIIPIGVKWGYAVKDELENENPLYIANTVEDLRAFFII